MLTKRYTIYGYGWLGKRMAFHWLGRGDAVHGITRNETYLAELRDAGGVGIRAELSPTTMLTIPMPPSHASVIALPPGIRSGRGEVFPDTVSRILEIGNRTSTHWVFISSTSVYPQSDGEWREEDAQASLTSDHMLLQAEARVLQAAPDALIIRAAGLIGEDRHPVRFLAGRQDIADGDSPVNLISGEDVASAVDALLIQQRFGTFNICSSHHPTKKEYYTSEANKRGLPSPHFRDGGPQRVISNAKIRAALGDENWTI